MDQLSSVEFLMLISATLMSMLTIHEPLWYLFFFAKYHTGSTGINQLEMHYKLDWYVEQHKTVGLKNLLRELSVSV